MYKIIEYTDIDRVITTIKRIDSDNSVTYIPMSEENADYKKYLEWLAEGNEPLPADE